MKNIFFIISLFVILSRATILGMDNSEQRMQELCNSIYQQNNTKVKEIIDRHPMLINAYHRHDKNCEIFNAEYQRIYSFCQNDQITPLHIAVTANNYDGTKLLLHEYKANPNKKTIFISYENATPLHLAQNSTIAHLLLVFDAQIEAKDFFNRTPLCLSLFNPYVYPNLQVAEVLAKWGANIDQVGAAWGTSLHEALHCSGGMIDIIKFLLRHGANKNMVNNSGETPLKVAIQLHSGYDKLINLLR